MHRKRGRPAGYVCARDTGGVRRHNGGANDGTPTEVPVQFQFDEDGARLTPEEHTTDDATPADALPPNTGTQACTAVNDAPSSDEEVASRKRRRNWSGGELAAKLAKASSEWLDKSGPLLGQNPKMSLRQYAERVGIPRRTFRAYVHKDPAKRQTPGSHAGMPELIDAETQRCMVDVLVRRDRGNDGLHPGESIELLHDLKPQFTQAQIRNAFHRTVRAKHSDRLTGVVKAQASTSKRSAITVPQQYR